MCPARHCSQSTVPSGAQRSAGWLPVRAAKRFRHSNPSFCLMLPSLPPPELRKVAHIPPTKLVKNWNFGLPGRGSEVGKFCSEYVQGPLIYPLPTTPFEPSSCEINMYHSTMRSNVEEAAASRSLNLNINLSLSVAPDARGCPCSNTCCGRGDCGIGSYSSNRSYSSSRNGGCSSNDSVLCVRAAGDLLVARRVGRRVEGR